MRYELGDVVTGPVVFDPNAPDAPPVKTDQKATVTSFDKKTGATLFEVAAPGDAITENPLLELVVVFANADANAAQTAADFLALPDDTCPKARVTLTPDMYGQPLTLPRPDAMVAGTSYRGQSILGYSD